MSRIAGGTFVAVVGPSGAGKDSVLAYARARLPDPRIRFVRRVITRRADPALEDHDSLDTDAFALAEARGTFALSWRANGLAYGIPVDYDDDIRMGRVVVANLSRGAVEAARRRYASVVVAEIGAAPAVLAARLVGRGRESAAEIEARLSREGSSTPGAVAIDNSGPLAQAGGALVALIGGCLAESTPA